MINIFQDFKQILFTALQKIATTNNVKIDNSTFEEFNLEPSKDKSHGDIATNIAMAFSKNFSAIQELKNPRKLAEKLIELISANENISKAEVAGPGFINISLKNSLLYKTIAEIVVTPKYKLENIGKGAKINLEYASPNPTGPIHVGHCRGAIYGDVLANLLQRVGFDVLKEYYINDAGAQIDLLLKSAYLRYLESCGEKITISEGLYPGAYLMDVGNKLKAKFGNKFQEINLYAPDAKSKGSLALKASRTTTEFTEFRNFVVNSMLTMIKEDLRALGIEHESYFSEKENLHDTNKINEAIEILRKKDLIYEGKLEAPKTEKGVGLIADDYDDVEQTLFRSTIFGDDQDRVVSKIERNIEGEKNDQEIKKVPTYFAADLAYIRSKFERGANTFIMPLGFDHAGYIKRLTAAVLALTDGQATLKIILCQMVKFVKNGQPIKMSKRADNFITAKEVLDEVGKDVMRFIMLTRKNDTPFDFDLAKVIEHSKDNPIFYVQYAHTRCCSVIRNLIEQMPELANIEQDLDIKNIQIILNNLQDESEIDLMKKIATYQRVIEAAVTKFEPHHIAFYLQELAAIFHSLWNKGSDNPSLKFIIKNNVDLTKSRIYLLIATKKIIASALDIFNITPLEEMN